MALNNILAKIPQLDAKELKTLRRVIDSFYLVAKATKKVVEDIEDESYSCESVEHTEDECCDCESDAHNNYRGDRLNMSLDELIVIEKMKGTWMEPVVEYPGDSLPGLITRKHLDRELDLIESRIRNVNGF